MNHEPQTADDVRDAVRGVVADMRARERALWGGEPPRMGCGAAAMRRVLEAVAENLAIHIQCGRFVAPGDHVSFPICEADAYIRDIRAALDAPARNCDRFSRAAAAEHSARARDVEDAQREANARADRLRDLVRRLADNLRRYHILGDRDNALLREAREALGEAAP